MVKSKLENQRNSLYLTFAFPEHYKQELLLLNALSQLSGEHNMTPHLKQAEMALCKVCSHIHINCLSPEKSGSKES